MQNKAYLGPVRTSISNEDRSSSFHSLKLFKLVKPSNIQNLYFLCSATQLQINCSYSKGYIYFILIQFKIQKAITNHSIYCNSWHSSSKLNFDIFCERVDTGRFLLWWGSSMMPVPEFLSSWVHPQSSDQNILLVLCLELHPKTSVISPCHILWTLWNVHFITWIINSVSALPTSCTLHLLLDVGPKMAWPGPASRWLMIRSELLMKPNTGCLGQ